MAIEVWVGMGSNLEDRAAHLRFGLKKLSTLGDIRSVSQLYESRAWGNTDQPAFYNAVCLLHIDAAEAVTFLGELKGIEKAAGRKDGASRWEPRPLDLDILYWGNLVINTEILRIPHALMAQRRFVLEPLAELAPDLRHPVSGLTTLEMLNVCRDTGEVLRLGEFNLVEHVLGA